MNLEPGELVRVRSQEEIERTLDAEGRLTGLYYMPSMRKYSGCQFRVYKKVKKIILETTGQLREMRSPTVFLEGVTCDGCDRECFCFWREDWLERVK